MKKNLKIIAIILIPFILFIGCLGPKYNGFLGSKEITQEFLSLAEFEKNVNCSRANFSIYGEIGNSNLGKAASGIGDVNGDGIDDFLVAAPQFGTGGGKVYLFFGKLSGWNKNINCSDAEASFIAEFTGDLIGRSVSGAGDVNGDGYDDFLFSSTSYDKPDTDIGKTYLFFGKESGWEKNVNCSNADASFIGESPEDLSGSSISGIGDVNNDGYDDFLIGAIYFSSSTIGDEGKVYLFFGKESGWEKNVNCSNADASFIGESPEDQLGGCVAGAGDVNGDGYDDFLFSSTRNDQGGTSAGKTYLMFGKESEWYKNINCSETDASFIGEAEYDYSGWSVDGAGDINGDNLDDIIIGAPYNDRNKENNGQTYVFFGKDTIWGKNINCSDADASFIGESKDDHSGIRISRAGKINDDEYDDLLISAPLQDENSLDNGKVYLIYGKSSNWNTKVNLSEVDVSFYGENQNDYLGQHRSVAAIGDVDGDGSDDFILASDSNDDYGGNVGKAYIFFGEYKPDPKIIITYPINGTEIGRELFNFTIIIQSYYLIDNMWYTIEGGIIKYSFSSNGTIDTAFLSMWDSKADGETIIIEFFANDSLGQISNETLTLIKKVPESSDGGGIPGYDLAFMLLGILPIIEIIYFKKKSKIKA